MFLSKKLVFVCIFFTLCFARAHEVNTNQDPYEMNHRYGLLLEKISLFQMSQTPRENRKATPYVRIGRRNHYINNAFFEITEEILRLYSLEISQACPDCRVPSVTDMNQQARELVAKGYFTHLSEHVIENVASPMSSEFVDLGSRFGTAAGLLKVAGEVAEEALLVMFKLPGAHFLCEIITLVIAARSGNVLTLYRTWSQASGLGRGSMTQLARLTATAWVAKRALRRIRLDFGPVEVDPALIQEEKLSDPRKEWLSEEIKDEKSYRRFFERSQKVLQTSQENIENIEQQISDRREQGLSTRRLDKRLQKETEKLGRLHQVTQKVFEGRGYNLSFRLIKRNRPMSLYSDELELNPRLKGSKLWLVPLTATVIEPGFIENAELSPQAHETYLKRVSQNTLSFNNSEVDQILMQEASERGLHADFLPRFFAEFDFIFDTSETSALRYIHITHLQSFLGEFMYQLGKTHLRHFRKEVISRSPDWKTYRSLMALQWRAGQLVYNANLFTDYLKSVSLVKGRNNFIHEKDFSKEFFLRLIESYEILSQLNPDMAASEVSSINQKMKERLQLIRSQRFWVEKKAGFTLLPVRSLLASSIGLGRYQLFRKRAMCSRLYY